MKHPNILIYLILSLGALSACGGGSGGSSSSPTDPEAVFTLGGNPLQLQRGMTVDLKGKDTSGDSWKGIVRMRSLDAVLIDSEWVTPHEVFVTLTYEREHAQEASTTISYIDSSGVTIKTKNDMGVECFMQTPGDYPETAKIGAFGNLESMACSDGTNTSGSWALDDGRDGYANLVITEQQMRSANGRRISTSEMTTKLSKDGEAHHFQLHMTFHELGESITLSGSPR